MLDVKPTRSELLKLKRKIALAKSGHKLLKKKRDGLIMEFFNILKEAKQAMIEAQEAYDTAVQRFAIAEMSEGATKLRSISMAIAPFPNINFRLRNVMGVSVPEIELAGGEKHFYERGPGILSTNARVDEASYYYQLLIKALVKYAEKVSALYRMLDEIEKTKRKVNALEFEVIPKLENAASFIYQRLEEMERENIFRLKRIKAKKALEI